MKMKDKQWSSHYQRLRKFLSPEGKTVTTSDGKSKVMAPIRDGHKPGRNKRKPKTVSLPYKKHKKDM